MIPALLTAAALAGGTAGVQLGAWAWQTPPRHAVLLDLGLWGTHTLKPWSLTAELASTWRSRGADSYHYRTLHTRLSVVGGLAMGSHASTLHLGAGPALTARLGKLSWEGGSAPVRALQGGVRLRMALDGPLGQRLAWCWHMAGTTRGWSMDWDTAVGLGVPW